MSKRFGKKTWRLEVEWEDSTLVLEGWTRIRKLLTRRKRVVCRSVGYVLADDKRGIVLAGSVNGWNAAQVVHIPASQVRKRRRLR